ncbi:GNAT family N-acetyltransferase [Deinococcus xinjiangensis]|uniref:GNAT family N-acetyltransferase n=1 Tax=Deinococcus xinjiangensis TaxID=457454 RepID=UPI003365985A
MRVVPFDERFDTSTFECLDEHLTAYLKEGRAVRDLNSGQAAVFLLVDAAGRVLGYYTLSAASVDRKAHFTNSQGKQFGYPQVAVTLLGRVAVHRELKGQGVGTDLIVHALKQAARASETVASYAVILDAKNERVAAIYARLGFVPFKDQPLKMFLPMATIRQLE